MSGHIVPVRGLYRLSVQVGWSGEQAVTATVVALAASGGNSGFQMVTSPEELTTYRGLWGIPVGRKADEELFGLYEPLRNARAAYSAWSRSGHSWRNHWCWPLDGLESVADLIRQECRDIGPIIAPRPMKKRAVR